MTVVIYICWCFLCQFKGGMYHEIIMRIKLKISMIREVVSIEISMKRKRGGNVQEVQVQAPRIQVNINRDDITCMAFSQRYEAII
jgi:hypothetical protein